MPVLVLMSRKLLARAERIELAEAIPVQVSLTRGKSVFLAEISLLL